MKIKFAGWWNVDYNIFLFVNDIWNINGSFNDFITYENDYTHLVIMNYVNNSAYRIEKEKTYGIVIEPYWSENFDKNMLNYCKKIITYQPEKYQFDRTVHYPLIGTHRLYDANSDGSGEITPHEGRTKNIISSKFEKNKKLSIIVSNAPHDSRNYTNYNKRRELVQKLMNSDIDFDMYGRGWNLHDKRYKGPLMNKINGISKYEYSLCLENSSISGNITEKFIDAILCDTIPIYNGHRDIEKFYPNSCEYLEYDGNEIHRIKEIINSNKTLKDYSIDKAKSLYLNTYNPIKIIIDEISKQD